MIRTLIVDDERLAREAIRELVEAVGAEAMPLMLFVTAHDLHALKAFEAQALDYAEGRR